MIGMEWYYFKPAPDKAKVSDAADAGSIRKLD